MSDPTDRERVAHDLCAQEGGACQCLKEKTAPCSYMLAIAARAIALGAKPPVDPVDELIAEMRIWLNRHAIFRNRNGEWLPGGCMAGDIVRHVLDRAKEMGL